MDHLATSWVASWGYLALFVITMLSAVGVPVGSEIAIGYAGALASGAMSAGSAHLDLKRLVKLGLDHDGTSSTVAPA